MLSRLFKSRHTIIIFILAALLTAAGTFGSAKLNRLYLQYNSFFGDTSSYYYMQNAVYADVLKNGKWKALENEFRSNGRNPLRTIPLLLIAPELLPTINGHLYTAGFMLFFLLLLLGYTVYKRTGTVIWALVSQLAFFAADYFLHPTRGFGANYPDLHAAYLTGAAVFALINSDFGKRTNWYWVFGIFAALTALARFVAAGYLFFICAPVLLWFLFIRFREDRSVKNLLMSIAKAGLPILLLSGYYFIEFTAPNLRFYSVAGYALNNELFQVISDFIRLYKIYMGTTGYSVLAIFFTFYCFLFWKDRANVKSLILTIWVAFAQIIFIVFVLKVGDDWLTFNYALPGFLLLMLAPFDLKKSSEKSDRIIDRKFFGAVMSVILLWIGVQHFIEVRKQLIYPAPDAIAELDFQRRATDLIINKSRRYFDETDYNRVPVFDTFFYEYGRSIVNEAFLRNRRMVKWRSFYSVHPGGWKMAYQDKPKEQICNEIYEKIKKELDFVFIIANPGNPNAADIFNNEISMSVIKETYRKLLADTGNWKHEAANGAELHFSGPWGEFHLFRNLKRTSGSDFSKLKEYAYRITSDNQVNEILQGGKHNIDLKVINTSKADWDMTTRSGIHGFYYWMDESGKKSVYKGFDFEKKIKAGETCGFSIEMETPKIRGDYELVISLVHEDHAFFDDHGNKPYRQKIKIK